MSLKKIHSGFTLIELIIVMAILGVMLSIVLAAINPAKRFSQANNTKRKNDTSAILNAISQYAADNRGVLPSSITLSVQNIASPGANLCSDLLPTYTSILPSDPKVNSGKDITICSSSYDTGYTVVKDSNNRVTVAAPQAELQEVVSFTR